MSKVIPTQKFGYIDIKQSSKVRPRKLKSWKHRWAVLTKMSNLSSEEYVAKLDLYDNENKWRSNSSDKMTFVIENVTCIKPVKSKTHQHAFEIVENQPVLVMSGVTELESYSWILSLQQIFTPEQIEAKKDCYQVTVSPNEHSQKWNLSGDYSLSVSSTCISLGSREGTCVISWGLNTLMRFNVEQSIVTGQMDTLVIECGPHASTGQSCFHFLSEEAGDVLGAIRQSICLALAEKQNARGVQSNRQRSLSATVSEKNFQKLLDHQTHSQSIPVYRSDSSSSSSANFGSPAFSSKLSCSPGSLVAIAPFILDEDSITETRENIDANDLQKTKSDIPKSEVMTYDTIIASSHKRCSSHPDNTFNGYSEIRDATADKKPVSRRNTLSGEPQYFDIDRIRSVSDVVASVEARTEYTSVRRKSFQNSSDVNSDLNSATSSTTMPPASDEQLMQDVLHGPDTECSDGHCPCSFTRRRSSSTPDLMAYWKMHNSTTKYENVYEELDELRASMQRLNKKQDSTTPPELPARPFSIHFTYNTDFTTKSTGAMKQPSSNWYGKPNLEAVKDKSAYLCTCDSFNGRRSRFDSDRCPICKCEISKKRTDKMSAKEKSPCSDINDIILQVQNVKRRRSSDITPVSPSFLFSPSDISTAKSGATQTQEKGPESSLWTKPNAQENLINLHLESANLESGLTLSKSSRQSVESYTSRPLTRFFLDGDSFDSNPVAIDEFSAQLSSNTGHLTKSSFSSPDVPVLNAASLTQPNRTWTWPGGNIGYSTDTDFELHVSNPNSLDIWVKDTTNSNYSNQSRDFLSGAFSHGPLAQKQTAPAQVTSIEEGAPRIDK